MPRYPYVVLIACLAVFATPRADEIALVVTDATLVTMQPGAPAPIEGWMSVDTKGRIAGLGAGAPPTDIEAAEVLDAKGRIVMPGFVSAHSHLWSAPFRGIAAESNLYDWIAEAHRPFSPYYQRGDFHTFTTYGVLDFLSHGITTAYN